MIKRVLLVAYHYPPVAGSSGVQRTLKFSQYLPEFGWEPIVLTISLRAYEAVRKDQLGEIPENLIVARAFGIDAARHLSVGGKYLDLLAYPDRWVSWWPTAVMVGRRLIRRYRVRAIWSTYPIATAHLIGRSLHLATSLPWIADFRDSMTETYYPPDRRRRQVYRWIERRTVRDCSRALFTTPGAMRMYAERYPEIPDRRWSVLANGFDEENFTHVESRVTHSRRGGASLRLLHSGILYPEERDPSAFFEALAALKKSGRISAQRLTIVLRATGHDNYHRDLLARYGIADIVRLEPGIAYESALQEMLEADGLLLFQAANCNHQIPAKAYEYLRARRPVLAFTDPAGDTAGLLRDAGIDTIVPLDDANVIAASLGEFLGMLKQGSAPLASEAVIASHSRRQRTEELATILNEVAD